MARRRAARQGRQLSGAPILGSSLPAGCVTLAALAWGHQTAWHWQPLWGAAQLRPRRVRAPQAGEAGGKHQAAHPCCLASQAALSSLSLPQTSASSVGGAASGCPARDAVSRRSTALRGPWAMPRRRSDDLAIWRVQLVQAQPMARPFD